MKEKLPLIICVLLGMLACLGLPPWGYWPLMLVGWGGFYLSLGDTKPALKTFFFGFGYFLLGLYWIGNAIFQHWDEYWWAYPLALLGIPFLLAAYWALFGKIISLLTKSATSLRFLGFIVLFGLAEWIRSWIFTGFPWNVPGYVWNAQLEIAQLAHIIKIDGLTILTLFWAATIGHVIVCYKARQPAYSFIPLALTLITAVWGFMYGDNRLKSADLETAKAGVLIVQPSIPQKLKWDQEQIPNHIDTLLTLSSANQQIINNNPDMERLYILWPETAIANVYLKHPYFKQKIKDMLQAWPIETYLITGVLNAQSEEDRLQYYNSIFMLDQNAEQIARYDKTHLVPFGEYIPFIPPEMLMPLNVASYQPGLEYKAFTETPETLLPLICYEAIFPTHITGPYPDNAVLTVVTNDAWYNDAPGPYQHHAMARFRAIEHNRMLVRSANTGISGAFDPYGQSLITIKYNQQQSSFVRIQQ